MVIVIYRSKGGNPVTLRKNVKLNAKRNIFFNFFLFLNERAIKCMQRGIWGWCLGKTSTGRSHRRQLLRPQAVVFHHESINLIAAQC